MARVYSHLKPPVVSIVLDHIHEVASQRFQEVGRVHLCLDLQFGTQAGGGRRKIGERKQGNRGEEMMKKRWREEEKLEGQWRWRMGGEVGETERKIGGKLDQSAFRQSYGSSCHIFSISLQVQNEPPARVFRASCV